jgi:hypothetical protein
MVFVFATAIFLLEGLIDAFKGQVEATAATAAPASAGWLQNQILLFQYDATNPQIVQLINFAPVYPVVDPTKRIISRVSVVTGVSGQTTIKVATGIPPGALNDAQLSALQSYVTLIGATIDYNCVSLAADKLYIDADVYYQGQYSAIIKDSVINAINNYLATFSSVNFNGTMKVSDIEATILAVPGVNDVVINNMIARADGTPFSGGTYLVQNAQLISRIWPTISGYLIEETTSGETFADSLNFIAQ